MDFNVYDVVEYEGESFICILRHNSNVNNSPSNNSDVWNILANKGAKGVPGNAPKHEWQNTSLRFQKEDGTWGEFVNLKGE